jgi:tetratricopeptide (TPR) repeat protein
VLGHDRLRAYLALEHGVPIDMLAYGVLSTDAFSLLSRPDAPLNTLDFPALEQEMSRLDTEARLYGLSDLLVQRLDLRAVGRALGPPMGWDPGAFALWGDLRLSSSTMLFDVLRQVVRREFGDVDPGYARAAAEQAAALGTAQAHLTLGELLVDRGLCSAALPLLERASRIDPTRPEAPYLIGRCHERQGSEAQAAEAYGRALRVDPRYDPARSAGVRLERRGGDVPLLGGDDDPEER